VEGEVAREAKARSKTVRIARVKALRFPAQNSRS
jgi:hypothetical protein